MKKNFNFLTWAFAALMLVVTSACGDDDDIPPKPEKETTATIVYAVPALYDLADIADVKISYKGADGKMIEKAITESPVSFTIEKVKIPFEAKMTINATKKAGFTPTKDKYDLGKGFGIAAELSTGTIIAGPSAAIQKGLKAEFIDKYLSTNFPKEYKKDIVDPYEK